MGDDSCVIMLDRVNPKMPSLSLNRRAAHLLKSVLIHNFPILFFFPLCLLIAASHQLINLSKCVSSIQLCHIAQENQLTSNAVPNPSKTLITLSSPNSTVTKV